MHNKKQALAQHIAALQKACEMLTKMQQRNPADNEILAELQQAKTELAQKEFELQYAELFCGVQAEIAAIRTALGEASKAVEAVTDAPDTRVYSDEILPIFIKLKAMRDAQKANAPNRKKLERELDGMVENWMRS